MHTPREVQLPGSPEDSETGFGRRQTEKSPRLLVIDDDKDDFKLVSKLLREAYGSEYRADWASSWDEAVEQISKNGHEAYLLDSFLGGRDGLDLVREAMSRGCEEPIILLTGRLDREVDVEAIRAGAADYLVKEETSAALLERAIRYAIARNQNERRLSRQSSADGPSILLVDDDEDDYILTRAMLFEIHGSALKLEWAQSWDDALEQIRQQAHDVYLFDYRLGPNNGIDLVRAAMTAGCQSPIILLTGQGNREIDLEAMQAGADDYLVKGEITAPLLDRAIRYAVERRRSEQRLAALARYDQLSGLANRHLFREFLSRTVARADRLHRMVAVLFVDLNRFKAINDTLGHHAGDEVLKTVAERLGNCVRASDIVARLGGDEFSVVLDEISDPMIITHFCERIIGAIKKPMMFENNELSPSCSVGVAVYPSDADNVDDLLKSADTAMYHAKAQGPDHFQFYTMSLHVQAFQLVSLENELRNALEQGEFRLCYQPEVDAKTGRVVCLEALLRWEHPARGTIFPAEFIDLAEESGLMVPIGQWVLETACKQIYAWREQGISGFRVAVNLSARQLEEDDLVATVANAIQSSGIEPWRLELEITERSILKDQERVRELMSEFSGMGLEVSLDDFGTGYSSLNHLRSFPGSSIKIDGSFVENLPGSHHDSAIVKAVILMAHSLGMRVVAEGVASRDHVRILKEYGCDVLQGWYFSKPLYKDQVSTDVLAQNAMHDS